MPSAFSHVFAAAALAKTFTTEKLPNRFWVLAAISAVIPDLDVIGFAFGIEYGDMLGHRGLTHSLAFALLWSVIVVCAAFGSVPRCSGHRWKLVALLFAATASHGILDAFTNGGLGVAFFAPFDATRHFFRWRPIEVSPIGFGAFFGERGQEVFRSELKFIWLPFASLWLSAVLGKRLFRFARGNNG